MVAPGDFNTIDVIYTKEGKSDETHGLLARKWDQRETISVRYVSLANNAIQPTFVKRVVEQKPPVGQWKLVAEKSDVPPELLTAVPMAN
jgi:hypothetical protein